MIYLESFRLATESDETDYILDVRKSYKLDMSCHDMNNSYPFKIFPFKYLSRLDFAPITLLYGGNGSGKSTLLNIIAQKLKLHRTSPTAVPPSLRTTSRTAAPSSTARRTPPRGAVSSPATTSSTIC